MSVIDWRLSFTRLILRWRFILRRRLVILRWRKFLSLILHRLSASLLACLFLNQRSIFRWCGGWLLSLFNLHLSGNWNYLVSTIFHRFRPGLSRSDTFASWCAINWSIRTFSRLRVYSSWLGSFSLSFSILLLKISSDLWVSAFEESSDRRY